LELDRNAMAIHFDETKGARDPRALAILAKTIYRELRSNGYEERDVVALAGELLGQVAAEAEGKRRRPTDPR
jgi:3-hydroxyisobutyrate dehydrogenase-like beta-hydroxyacid dehydrogenase